jgi:hypothetical protein
MAQHAQLGYTIHDDHQHRRRQRTRNWPSVKCLVTGCSERLKKSRVKGVTATWQMGWIHGHLENHLERSPTQNGVFWDKQCLYTMSSACLMFLDGNWISKYE